MGAFFQIILLSLLRLPKHQLWQMPPKGRPGWGWGREALLIPTRLWHFLSFFFGIFFLAFIVASITKSQDPIMLDRKELWSLSTPTLPMETLKRGKWFAQATHWVSGRVGTRTGHSRLLLQCSFSCPASPLPHLSLSYPKQPLRPFLLRSRRSQVWESKLKIRVNLQFWKYSSSLEMWLTKERVRKCAV